MATFDELFPTIKPVGLCHVTGQSGVGKSTFAIGLVMEGLDPKRIAVLDAEQSQTGNHEQLGFGVYHDVIAMHTKAHGLTGRPRQLYKLMVRLANEIPDEGIDVIVLDNVVPLEGGIVDEVETNPGAYGLTKNQIERGGGLKWGPIKTLYRNFIQSLGNKAPMYVFTSQLGAVFAGGKPVPGLYKPRGKQDVLSHQSYLRLWLQFRPEGEIPSGLVMKSRLTRWVEEDGKRVPRPLLPRRLPLATWGAIMYYFEYPPDLKSPAPGEAPTTADWYKLRGTMSPEQLEIFKTLSKLAEKRQEEDTVASTAPAKPSDGLPRTPAEFIVALATLPMPLPEALERLGKELPAIEPREDFLKLKGGMTKPEEGA